MVDAEQDPGEAATEEAIDAPQVTEAADMSEVKEDTSIPIFSGEELSLEEAREITCARKTRFIVIAGPVNCGKTTMLACIYELFRQGRLGPFAFAGSQTLLDFETCCHEARIVSGRVAPSTTHTTSHEHSLLHLQVSEDETGTDLLMTNISGEVFKDIRDSSSECETHTVFRRADRFAVVIDGAKLADDLLRTQTIADAIGIFRRCLDTGILGKQTFVDVIFAKWDLVAQWIVRNGEAEEYLDSTWTKKFVEPFEARVGRLQRWEVAARPVATADGSGLEFGHGLGPLLKAWVRESAPSRIKPDCPGEAQGYRQIDRQPDISQWLEAEGETGEE